MPKLDLDTVDLVNRTTYPAAFAGAMAGRFYRRLAPASGITDFGVSYVTLAPGGLSSQRHWHEDEDEMVVMLSGEAVLVEDEGETILRAGDVAAFPKGVANGHHLVNRSDQDCTFIAIGAPPTGTCHYSDIDLLWDGPNGRFTHKDGRSY